jgi:hypothetical protein
MIFAHKNLFRYLTQTRLVRDVFAYKADRFFNSLIIFTQSFRNIHVVLPRGRRITSFDHVSNPILAVSWLRTFRALINLVGNRPMGGILIFMIPVLFTLGALFHSLISFFLSCDPLTDSFVTLCE